MQQRARFRSAIVLFAVFASSAFAKNHPKVTSDELAQITERGRALYAYDQAAWHSTDAVVATHPEKGEDGRYIAERTRAGWVVAFGHLNQARDAFLIAHLATQGQKPEEFSVEHLTPAKPDTGFFLAAAKAIDLCLQDFQGENVPYNVAVLPAPNGQLYVYVLPAQTKETVYLIGGDERYTVSGDGTTIAEKHRMHRSIIPFDVTSIPPGTTISGGFHSHILSDVPEDSDVFYVLTRRPSMPEFIATPSNFHYEINPDGTIAIQK